MNKGNYTELATRGAVITIEIRWDCNLDFDFMTHCLPKYAFDILDNTGWNFRHALYHEEDRRTLVKAYGLKFLISVTGTARKFDITKTVVIIVTGLGLMGLANIMCDIVLLKSSHRYRDEIAKKKFELIEMQDDKGVSGLMRRLTMPYRDTSVRRNCTTTDQTSLTTTAEGTPALDKKPYMASSLRGNCTTPDQSSITTTPESILALNKKPRMVSSLRRNCTTPNQNSLTTTAESTPVLNKKPYRTSSLRGNSRTPIQNSLSTTAESTPALNKKPYRASSLRGNRRAPNQNRLATTAESTLPLNKQPYKASSLRVNRTTPNQNSLKKLKILPHYI